ncbi:PcfJ domain-containing protein [Enterococcus faecium]
MNTAVEKRGGKLIPGVEQYLSYRQVESIPKQIGIVKFQNYLIKQGVQFSHYKDYLMMLKDLRIDLNKASLLPSDINKAVETLNTMKRKITHEGFKVQAKKLAYMEMSLSGFSFILPKTPDDLIQEGENLHHCVGGSRYIEKHGRGESTIIFVRKNNNLKQSYFTIEYAIKRIIQIQGKRNREKVSPKLKQAVDLWLKEVERKKNGKKVA